MKKVCKKCDRSVSLLVRGGICKRCQKEEGAPMPLITAKAGGELRDTIKWADLSSPKWEHATNEQIKEAVCFLFKVHHSTGFKSEREIENYGQAKKIYKIKFSREFPSFAERVQ